VGAGAKITNAPLGGSYQVAITITGIGGFAGGTATLAATSSDTTRVTVTPATQSVPLATGDSIAPLVTVTFLSTAAAGSASITINVNVGATVYPTITIPVSIAASSSNAGLCLTTCANLAGIVSSLDAVSAGYLAEREHATKVLTMPVYGGIDTFGYLASPTSGSDWKGIINQVGIGATANFWEWLNAWNAGNPTINVGFSEFPDKLNPTSASTVWDFYLLGNIFDSLFASPTPYFTGAIPSGQPTHNGGTIDWLTLSHQFPLTNAQLGYTPPAGTIETLRASLRPGVVFHDGQPLTAFDVAFSYNFLIKDGSFQGGGLLGIVSGVTVLSAYQFDINLSQEPFSDATLGGLTILPGHVWSNCNTAAGWNNFVNTASLPFVVPIGVSGTACSTGGTMDSPHTGVTFDPLSASLLIGTGPWVCESTGPTVTNPGFAAAGTVGTDCSSSGGQSATGNGAYTLTRNGCTITSAGTQCVPAGTIITSPGPTTAAASVATANGNVQSTYVRSPGAFAKYIWSKIDGNPTDDFGTLATVANTCQQTAGSAFVSNAACATWQNGIGSLGAQIGNYIATGCNGTNQCNVEASQVNLVNFFKNNAGDWTAPIAFPYTSVTIAGTSPLNPTLYEGVATLQSSTNGGVCTSGWLQSNSGTNGYDC
jgi:ABC-type transport system substrate-binding protein